MIIDLRSNIWRGLKTSEKIIKAYCPNGGFDGCIDQADYIDYVEKVTGKGIIPFEKESIYRIVQQMCYYEAGYYKVPDPRAGQNRTKMNRTIFDIAWKMI